MPEAITFLQLSDLHLTRPGQLAFAGDPLPRVRHVLAAIRGLTAPPAFVVISGDLSDDGSAESYEVINGVVADLGGAGVPVLLALGNHDDRTAFRRIVLQEEACEHPAPCYHSQVIAGLWIIMLDSQIPGEGAGALGAAQRSWLEGEVRAGAPRGSLIVLHHPCRLAGPAHHRPDVILRDAAEMEAIVARHRDQVVGVLAGHAHQANAALVGGVLHATAPAVHCQLDFFAGHDYVERPLSGFNLCQLEEGMLVVHPVLLPEW